ncbi:MAG TPA: thioredoxin-like domain-containing protein [Tepidisphaeraceae bacterium]|nr:thioredoxin-like domain-containing protein [Tepidisphaeraceae bacterium]
MRHRWGIVVLVGLFCNALALADSPAPPSALTLQDLVNRPDRWPPSVTLQHDFNFTNGAVAHQGDKATIILYNGSQLALDTGNNIRFVVKPEDCDLLNAANQYWSSLTPAQRAIDPTSLAADVSIWPETVKATNSISCQFGLVQPGTDLAVSNVTNNGIQIVWPKTNNLINLGFDTTNVFDAARQLVALDRDKRPSRIAAALDAIAMVDAEGKPQHDAHLQDKKYFVLYFGAGWCPPCLEFSPNLVNFANGALPKHPELAIMMFNEDKTPGDMLAYMKKENIPFPAAQENAWRANATIAHFAGRIIPDVVVLDRFGKILADNDAIEDNQGNHGDPMDSINTLTQLLPAPPPQQ